MSGRILTRLNELGIELPEASLPAANYVPYLISKDLIFISGQITIWNGELRYIGKIGDDLSIKDGIVAARLCGLNLIAQARHAVGGNLDKIKQVLKISGYVNASTNFKEHPTVINGASDLMLEVFGKQGLHTRIAVGVSSLPLGVSVEVGGIFEIFQEC
jgi:enamine deaminase RidA (YjgF/YER057c/UK114 family)